MSDLLNRNGGTSSSSAGSIISNGQLSAIVAAVVAASAAGPAIETLRPLRPVAEEVVVDHSTELAQLSAMVTDIRKRLENRPQLPIPELSKIEASLSRIETGLVEKIEQQSSRLDDTQKKWIEWTKQNDKLIDHNFGEAERRLKAIEKRLQTLSAPVILSEFGVQCR